MPDEQGEAEEPRATPKRRKRFKWRAWLRALHRDFGYVAVGLTFIYALSGLAVNHIADWDPSFVNFEREFTVPGPLPTADDAAAAKVLEHAGITETPADVYRVTDELLEITLEESTLHVTMPGGQVFEEGRSPRPFLRIANWLHLNRGKKAWTWFADAYAFVLVFLATSGMFMIAGKKGLLGRGAFLVGLGVLAPVAYLVYFGSP
ncbi:MAG: PepSY-associated TM helix domain-containing protein [Myxococcota bacterium]